MEIDAEIDRRIASNKVLTRPRVVARPQSALGRTVAAASDPGVPRHTAAEAAASVSLFEEGKGIRDAVRELKISYEAARYLRGEYMKDGPELLLKSDEVRAIRVLLQWEGGEANAASLLVANKRALEQAAAVTQYLDRDERVTMEALAREEGFDAGFLAGQTSQLAAVEQARKQQREQTRQPPKSGPVAPRVPVPASEMSRTAQLLLEYIERLKTSTATTPAATPGAANESAAEESEGGNTVP